MAAFPSHWPHGVTYEVFVLSFADGNGDGKGDLPGLIDQLDYVQDLGVEAIWLMPIHPSPSYHKYDVRDYYNVHPDYGNIQDMRKLVREAHARGLRVLLDLVINHTSDLHPWFLEAQKGVDNPYRDHYWWSQDPEARARDAAHHWHALPGREDEPERYYGHFWHRMPDLNLDSPFLRKQVLQIGRFWLEDVGVDGFRLDAAKFLFCEDQPAKNHAWWAFFREEMQNVKPEVYLVGEVWDGPSVVAPYLGSLSACFNFQLSEWLLQTVGQGEDVVGLVDRYLEIQQRYRQHATRYVDATFLSNHDLERVGSVLKGSLNRMKMAASLLLTFPGAPFVYYGEELGMLGKKPDEYLREPFLWGKQRARWQTNWEEPRYSRPEQVASLEAQRQNPHSLYHHYRRLIHTRRRYKSLSLGSLEPVPFLPKQKGLLAFFRTHGQERLLVLHNLRGRRMRLRVPLATKEVVFCSRTTTRWQGQRGTLASFSTLILRV